MGNGTKLCVCVCVRARVCVGVCVFVGEGAGLVTTITDNIENVDDVGTYW